jgi:hypothetical protein
MKTNNKIEPKPKPKPKPKTKPKTKPKSNQIQNQTIPCKGTNRRQRDQIRGENFPTLTKELRT